MTDLPPKQARALWVQALESGEYKQGRGRLRDGNQFCCLGVACDLAIRHGVIPSYNPIAGVLYKYPEVVKWLGLLRPDTCYYFGQRSLTDDNDSGKSFLEIANIIKCNPPGLFTNNETEMAA